MKLPHGYWPHELPSDYTGQVWIESQVRMTLEMAAVVAEETVCDTHLPTGVSIYGSRAAKAIRALILPAKRR